jgi:tetratricopeptide (TPR) repeat protein
LAGVLAACGGPDRAPASGTGVTLPRQVTFNEHVAPVLYKHCAACHRPIEADGSAATPGAAWASPSADPLCVAGAPFSVLSYEAVRPRAKAMAAAVARRAMPPWLPEAGRGEFLNERRLSDAQIAIIQAWADQGAAEGDRATAPPLPTWPSGGWQLGTPDVVLTSDAAYTLQPGGRDVFRNFVLPVSAPATRFVRAVEFQADNPRVLHHANVGLDAARVARRLDKLDREAGFAAMPEDEVQSVFGWSPGKVPVMEPEEAAWVLEEGSDLVVQLHLVASRTAETIRPTVGLYLTDQPPTRAPIAVKLESKAIDIPAGEPRYVVEDAYELPVDVDAVSVYPHAHYLAKEMDGTAVLPDGRQVPLIHIRSWDVRWQDQYRYRTPISLPRGTTVRMRFTYDNSAANPHNRNRPPQRVRWGANSTDEMGALWLEVVPRRREDAAILAKDHVVRALKADIAGAELRVRAEPRDAAAHNFLATKLMQAGRLDDAKARLEEALRLAPKDAEARSNLGTVLQVQGQVAGAIALQAEAVRLKPDDDRLRFNLGNGYYTAGRLDDASRELRRAIAINADNGDAHFNLAMIVGPQGRVDEAIAHLERAIAIQPRNGDAHRNLAVALGLKGRLDEAIHQARIARRLLPDSREVADHLARLEQAKAARDILRPRGGG